jgi:hypothetical protein
MWLFRLVRGFVVCCVVIDCPTRVCACQSSLFGSARPTRKSSQASRCKQDETIDWLSDSGVLMHGMAFHFQKTRSLISADKHLWRSMRLY